MLGLLNSGTQPLTQLLRCEQCVHASHAIFYRPLAFISRFLPSAHHQPLPRPSASETVSTTPRPHLLNYQLSFRTHPGYRVCMGGHLSVCTTHIHFLINERGCGPRIRLADLFTSARGWRESKEMFWQKEMRGEIE